MLANSFSIQAKYIFRATALNGNILIFFQGFRSSPQVLICPPVVVSSTGRREPDPLLYRHQFCMPELRKQSSVFIHKSNTDNTEVALGSRCCNTYRHKRLQQHMSLGRLIFFPSVLSPHSLTLLRQQSFMTCISAAPTYVRKQNLVFLKSNF